jgi:hypothetical protein
MTIQKAHFSTDGENVRLSMPFAKVDQERRIVSGFATLDNLDKQNDIVTPEASLKAFEKFRGNIREMHQPIAVGKMIAFKEDKYFDPSTKKFFKGVYVSAYISKGAQDCWEKVLDGTYSGFSIGGRMNEWDDAYDEKMDSQIRIIKDYDLLELSLVDTPANQFANILSVQKSEDGVTTVQGDVATVEIENVFWDKENGLVTISEKDSEVSPIDGNPMQNIGFVEKSDSEKGNLIKFLVDSAKGINTIEMNKENDNMSEEIVNDVPATEEEVENENVEIAPEADAEIEAPVADVEKADKPVDEEEAAEGDMDATESSQDEEEEKKAQKSDEVAANAVTDLKDAVTSAFSEITAVVKSLADEVAALKKSTDLANAKLADAELGFNNLGKRIDAVEADTAFRKSGDLGEVVQESEMTQKSLWGGRFLTTSELLK